MTDIMKFGSKEHCAELRRMRRMREASEAGKLTDKSTDADWLRERLFEYMRDNERLRAVLERVQAILRNDRFKDRVRNALHEIDEALDNEQRGRSGTGTRDVPLEESRSNDDD